MLTKSALLVRLALSTIDNRLSAIRALPADVGYQALSHLVSRGAILASGIIISRTAGIEIFADIQFYYVTAASFAIYLGLGIGKVAAIYFSTDIALATRTRRLEMIATIYVTLVACAVIFTVSVMGARVFLGDRLSFSSVLFGALVVALFLQEVLESVLGAQRRFKAIFLIGLVPGLGLVAAISVVALASFGMDAFVVSLTLSSVLGVSMLALSALLSPELRSIMATRSQLDFDSIRALFAMSIPMFFMGIVGSIAPWLIGRMMQDLASPGQLGIFLASLQWFSLILFAPLILAKVIAPEVVREVEQAKVVPEVFKLRIKIIGVAATLASGLTIVFSPIILWLYGASGSENQLRFCLMMISGMFAAPILPFANFILASRQAWKWCLIQVIFTCIVLAAYFGFLMVDLQLPEAAFLIGYALVFAYLIWIDSSSPWRHPMRRQEGIESAM